MLICPYSPRPSPRPSPRLPQRPFTPPHPVTVTALPMMTKFYCLCLLQVVSILPDLHEEEEEFCFSEQ